MVNDNLSVLFQVTMALAFVTMIHMIALALSATTRNATLPHVSQALVTGTAAGCALYPMLPVNDASWVAIALGLIISGTAYYLSRQASLRR